MSKGYINCYERLEAYFKILPIINQDTFEISLSQISTEFNIPIELIRQDFSSIIKGYATGDANSLHQKYLPIALANKSAYKYINLTTATSISEKILNGDLDNECFAWTINPPQLNHMLFLNDKELKIAQSILHSSTTNELNFDIKNNFIYQEDLKDLPQILDAVSKGINAKKLCYFETKKSNIKTHHIVTPIKILYDNEENKYSLLCFENKKLSAINFSSFVKDIAVNAEKYFPADACFDTEYFFISRSPAEKVDIAAIEEKIPHVWKNDFNTKKSVYVEVRFKEEVYEKVLNDLSYRNPEKTLTEPLDGYFFFRDNIYGKDAFESWVRKFGSNAIILKPESMAENRIKNLKIALKNYETGTFH